MWKDFRNYQAQFKYKVKCLTLILNSVFLLKPIGFYAGKWYNLEQIAIIRIVETSENKVKPKFWFYFWDKLKEDKYCIVLRIGKVPK